MKEEIIKILGINALELNSKSVINMGKALSYLDLQINMIANESKDKHIKHRLLDVSERAINILKK